MKVFLNNLNPSFKRNRKILKGKEIDCYSDSLKLGIEFCGLYWHSEKFFKDRKYHYSKFLECKKQDIQLITIFEDEWLERKQQVKWYLESKIRKDLVKIPARKCQIKEISNIDASEFIDTYHIQPLKPQFIKKALGLFYKNDLVSVMTFGIHHRNNIEITLNRYCVKNNLIIIGGASKLLKHSGYFEIISWSDNRWSLGSIYETLGFVKEEELSPDYSYVKNNKRFKKQTFQKKNLKGLLENETESQWCLRNNFNKIWDCGKIRWKYIK